MKKLIAAISAAVVLTACTDTDTFRVNGHIEGDPTINLRVGYYADGAYRTLITAAREGDFEFFGSARQPAIVTVFDYEYRPIASIYARNGNNYEISVDRSKPYAVKVSGDEISTAWADFLRDNADSLAAGSLEANRVVARYVENNPDKILSTILLTTTFDSRRQPALADSLLAMIAPEARPSGITEGYNSLLLRIVSETAADTVGSFRYFTHADSAATFNTGGDMAVLVFSDVASPRSDSIVPFIRRNYKDRRIADIGLDPEFGDWSRYTAPDSAKWTQGWLPGGPASPALERIAIPSLPFIVVTDSAGAQLLRTPWVAEAENYLKQL